MIDEIVKVMKNSTMEDISAVRKRLKPLIDYEHGKIGDGYLLLLEELAETDGCYYVREVDHDRLSINLKNRSKITIMIYRDTENFKKVSKIEMTLYNRRNNTVITFNFVDFIPFFDARFVYEIVKNWINITHED